MPTRLRDLSDTDFGTLDSTKNKNAMRYNGTTGKFDVITADDVLSSVAELPESFVQIVEDQIDVNNLTFDGVDGGFF
jgi:hypothetical protein